MRRQTAHDRRRWGHGSGGGVAPWTPADIAGLSWATEPDPAYQWQDTAQTTPADDGGEPIRRLVAKYGAAILLDAPSDSARPTYTTAGLGGTRPSQQYDGSNDKIYAPYSQATGAKWFACEIALSGTPTTDVLVSCREAPVTTGWEVVLVSNTSVLVGCGMTTTAAAAMSLTVGSMSTSRHTLLWTWDGVSRTATSSYSIWWDGVPASFTSSGSWVMPAGATVGVFLGSWFDSVAHYPAVHVGRMAAGTGALTSDERDNLHTWLGA